ncbi:chemosensory receptor a [Plakobranchus ocellatus]|uniref:Chemosensory receptor a n=1 Tax=Plakobranchus ocellatus TaxID=259542 RepID=A0AAV3YMR1_9GAST|nr:chemosensory receptor a [Plakobranchus ocellatus]
MDGWMDGWMDDWLVGWLVGWVGGIYIDTPPKDIIVEEGTDARFLCLTSVLPRSEGQEALITVHWTFLGQRLDKEMHGHSDAPARILMVGEQQDSEETVIESNKETKPRYQLRTFENRHVLVINKVRADDEGEYACVVTYGNKSERAKGSLTIKRIPESPEGVGVSCHGNTAEVSWRPGKPNGAFTSSYLVQYNLLENPDEWFSYYEDTVGTGTSAYIELAPYGVYSFRVIARNRFGESLPSAPTRETCTTPPDRPDRNPRHVRSRTDKKGYLVIEWEVNGSYASSFSQEVPDVYGLYEFQVSQIINNNLLDGTAVSDSNLLDS